MNALRGLRLGGTIDVNRLGVLVQKALLLGQTTKLLCFMRLLSFARSANLIQSYLVSVFIATFISLRVFEFV